MNRKRLVTLLVALVLPLLMVTAVLAGAGSARRVVAQSESIQANIPNSDQAKLDSETSGASVAAVPSAETATPQVPDDPEADTDSAAAAMSASPSYQMDGFEPRLLGLPGGMSKAAGDSPSGILQAPPMPFDREFVVDLDSERVWGVQNPGDSVTVTVNGTQMGAAVADGVGFFWTTLYDENGNRPGLTAGDYVVFYVNSVNGSSAGSVTLPDITGSIDQLTEQVTGNISIIAFSVTVYVDQPILTSYSVTTTLDASGNYTADFNTIWDYKDWDKAIVAATINQIEVHREVRVSPNTLITYPAPWNRAEGRAEPGSPVTMTLFYSNSSVKTSEVLNADEGGMWTYLPEADFLDSDYVQAEFEGGEILSRTIEQLTVNIDSANDRLTGTAKPFEVVRGQTSYLTVDGSKYVQGKTVADWSGTYTIQFGIDLLPDRWGGVYVSDTEGEDLSNWNHDAFLQVNQTYNEIWGLGPSPPGESEGRLITMTLSTTDTEFINTLNWGGRFDFNGDTHGDIPDIVPGDVVTVEVEGYSWQGVVEVGDISADIDVDSDEITGDVVTPTYKVEVSGSHWDDWEEPQRLFPIAGAFHTLTTANSPYTATPSGFDMRGAVAYNVLHRVDGDMVDSIAGRTDHLRVWPWYNGTLGWITPAGTPFTLTLKDGGGTTKDVLHGESSGEDGYFGWMSFDGTGEQIEPGDSLNVQASTGFSTTVQIPDIVVEFDLEGDTVYGTMVPNDLLYIQVFGQGLGFVPTSADGDFIIGMNQFQESYGDGDLEWGHNARVCHADFNGNHVCVNDEWPNITASYQEDGWNTVSGWTSMPENTIQISITDEISSPVDNGSTFAGDCKWCNSDEYWLEFPDSTFLPGYRVTADFGDGFVDYVDVAEISGTYNVDTDIVSGTVPPNSVFSFIVEEGPEYHGVEVDASGIYSFDLGMDGWDIRPGDYFHVLVPGRHNHQTEYVYNVPYVNIWLEKENTPGHTMPGHPALYRIRYGADGNTTAEDVVITDTLPVSTTYLGDTSGLPVNVNGRSVTWTVGTMEPGSNYDFFVSLEVGGDVPLDSELESNCARISTTSLGDDPEDNERCSGGVWVGEGEYGLGVQKWPEPGDPHPGQEFEYIIDYWSNGGVAVGPAWITDTLPDDTEVLWWYDENGWDTLWTEVITTGGTFALYAPAGVPGNIGGRIHLRLFLDESVTVSTTLENSVIITTSEDVNPDDNFWYDDSAHVSDPRYDVAVEKYVHNQVPIPGYWLNYFIDFGNNGNITTDIVVTDTLPDGVIFEEARWGGGQPHENELLPDPTIIGNKLVWELGALDVRQHKWFHIQVNISDDLSAEDVLTNCVEIESVYGEESTPEDNTSCTAVTLNDPGANLRVTKWGNYQNNQRELNYQLYFENIGNETISNVLLTDTLPISTTHHGGFDMNFEWERLIWEDQGGGMLRWEFSELHPGDSGNINFWIEIDDPNLRPQWFTNTVEITVPGGEISPWDNVYEVVHFLGEVNSVDLMVNSDHSNIWGGAQAGEPVTVTTQYTETYAVAQWDCGGCWNIDDAGPVWPGETISVTAGAGVVPVIFTVPEPFTTEADSDSDQVWGQIDHLDGERVEVQMDGFSTNDAWTDPNGDFSTTFPDIPRDGRGEVRYRTMVDNVDINYHNQWRTRDLLISVNYAHDWVNGNYEAGRTVWLTVTESVSTNVKGTAQLTTGDVEGWDQPGFSTEEPDWDGEQPDIVPGDWVFGYVDTGYSTEVHVGEITGNLDVDADSISGTVDADWWLPDTVDVRCQIWSGGGGAPGKEYLGLSPNGNDEYSCSWNPAEEWDIQPGDDVAVEYLEPDGDSVINVFYEATPYLNVWKNGNGEPGEGGNYAFNVEYRNEGEADAHDVVLTDTLLGNMTYINDTSGLPRTGTNPIVWDVGTLPPGDWIRFKLFVEVTGSEEEFITNTLQIETSSFDQASPEEKYVEWSGQITGNDTHLHVGKDAWTGDPAPGEPFIWRIDACNNGNTGSSTLTLTDTLPLSTTLDTWWGNSPWWLETYQDSDTLVLTYPTIESNRCEEVYLVTLLDGMASPGQEISNTVVISSSDDSYPGDNETSHSVWVGEPHTNLYVNKWWNSGQLVPGGSARYGIEAGNNGNTAVDDVVLTDTLPVSSTLVNIQVFDLNWNPQGDVTPIYHSDGVVAWEVGTLIPGEWKNFQLQIDFDPNVEPETVLTNSVEISPQPDEDDYQDNTAVHVEEIFEEGPNLRVSKWAEWEDRGNMSPRAIYAVRVENVGNQVVEPVLISDTYPASLYLEGGVDMDYWRWWDWGDNAGEHTLTVTLESLYGGDGVEFYYSLITDTEPLPEGMAFTNIANVIVDPEDANPDDNQDSTTLVSGPDLYVNKEWVDGDPVPGEIITFAIDFGNKLRDNFWWWNFDGEAWISDTLPAGTTFVTSTLSWCDWKGEAWCGYGPEVINGDELGWRMWPLSAGEELTLHVTVELTVTLEDGEKSTNLAEISSLDPANDLEYELDNNTDTADVKVIVPDPQADYIQNKWLAVVGETVYYTDTSTTNVGEIVAWEWDFDDGSPKEFTQDAAHAFTSAGDYSVTLVVTDTFGYTSSYSETTQVCLPVTEVSFTYDGDLFIGETITFTATITPSNASTPIEYDWDFGDGDGITTPLAEVTHVYTDGKLYTVTLTVSNACSVGVYCEEVIWVVEVRIYLPLVIR